MSEELMYECLKCGEIAPKPEWDRVEAGAGGTFKCPRCSFKIARKLRPPIAKRVKAI